MNLLLENCRFVQGIPPVADFMAGTVYTDIINAKDAQSVVFVVQRGVADDAEICTFTVEACDTTGPANTSAVPFTYRQISAADVEGAVTNEDTAGYSSTAASNSMDVIEVQTSDLPAGYPYVRLKSVESHDHGVLGGVLVILNGLRYAGGVTSTPTA